MRIKKVTNSMRYKMDEDITIEELDKYVKSHLNKKLKSPGPDGIPYEFILTLWSDLRRLIYNIIRWMFKNKIMPEKLPEGLIVFLPKKGKDQSILKNLRPLTLLNTLYKIASGILAERIKGILPKIISRDQYGFVNGRQAADLIQLAKELIDESRKTKQNLAVFAIDFSGAFDNISYKAIIDALLKKGFGGNFVTNIATLLTNNQSKIVINGKCKGGIKIEKSCRQGDPISPYLFIIVLDELLDSLNNNKKLKGYKAKCKGKEIKIKTAAFADDCYTFLSGNKKCIKNQVMIVKKILKEFEKKTGLAINVNKSELTTSGPIYNQMIEANEPERKIANISHKEEIKMLGVNVGIGADLKRDVVGRIAKSIEFWNRFRFSEIEKIDISNAFILPSVTHIIRHIPYESLLENQVNKLVLDFVWNKRRRYTNINVVQESIKKGGLNMRRFGWTWLNVLMGWFWRMYNADKDAAVVLDIGNQKYNRSRGFDIKHFLNVATTPEKRLKRKSNVFESSINLMENCWGKFLDQAEYNFQPLINNKRILNEETIILIKKENLPAFKPKTTFTTGWLENEIEEINRKSRPNLTEILTVNLRKKLLRRRPRAQDTRIHPNIRIEGELKNFNAPFKRDILKLENQQAKSRINNTMDKFISETNPILLAVRRNFEKELLKRNPLQNQYLNSALIRMRLKLRVGGLLDKKKLSEWKIVQNHTCDFCERENETVVHIIIDCEKLKPLWDEVERIAEQEWRVSLNLVDKIMGVMTTSEKKKRAEYLFLKSLWRIWGWKHAETRESPDDLVTKLKRALILYKEILNADVIK